MQGSGDKVKIGKEEFNRRVEFIKNATKSIVARLDYERSSIDYNESISELVQYDPKLAQLCMEADFASLEPMRKIVQYLSQKTEN